jgi:hypothetical protein
LSNPSSSDNDNAGNDENAVIASARKNNDDHDVFFFAPVGVILVVADKGEARPHGRPPTSMPLPRRRGGDLLSSKPQSNNDDKVDEALIASASKNDEDHVQLLSGLQTMVVLPV